MSARALLVAVDAPLTENLTYLQNENFSVQRGDVVYVSLGRRKTLGVVVNANVTLPEDLPYQLKPIDSLHEQWPRISETHMQWLEWISDYYLHPLGQVLQLCF